MDPSRHDRRRLTVTSGRERRDSSPRPLAAQAGVRSSPSDRLATASVLQASGFRGDVTVFRQNAWPTPKTGSEPAFRRNTAERVYLFEAAHNPEVAGSNPAPLLRKASETGPFLCRLRTRSQLLQAFLQAPQGHEGLLTTASTGTFGEATLEHFNVGDQAQLHRLEAGVLIEAPCCRILGPHAAGH